MSEIRYGAREKMTIIMSNCYTREGSACKLHPVFQPQKAINQILSIPELAVVDREAELPKVPYLPLLETANTYRQAQQDMLKEGWVREEKSGTGN